MSTPFWDEYASTAELLEQDGWTQVRGSDDTEVCVGDELFVRVFAEATHQGYPELTVFEPVEDGISLCKPAWCADYALDHDMHVDATPDLIELFRNPYRWARTANKEYTVTIWTRDDIPLARGARASVVSPTTAVDSEIEITKE